MLSMLLTIDEASVLLRTIRRAIYAMIARRAGAGTHPGRERPSLASCGFVAASWCAALTC